MRERQTPSVERTRSTLLPNVSIVRVEITVPTTINEDTTIELEQALTLPPASCNEQSFFSTLELCHLKDSCRVRENVSDAAEALESHDGQAGEQWLGVQSTRPNLPTADQTCLHLFHSNLKRTDVANFLTFGHLQLDPLHLCLHLGLLASEELEGFLGFLQLVLGRENTA